MKGHFPVSGNDYSVGDRCYYTLHSIDVILMHLLLCRMSIQVISPQYRPESALLHNRFEGCLVRVKGSGSDNSVCIVLDEPLNRDPTQQEAVFAAENGIEGTGSRVLIIPVSVMRNAALMKISRATAELDVLPMSIKKSAYAMCRLHHCNNIRPKSSLLFTCERGHFVCADHLIPWDVESDRPDSAAVCSFQSLLEKYAANEGIIDSYLSTRALMGFYRYSQASTSKAVEIALHHAATKSAWDCDRCLESTGEHRSFGIAQYHQQILSMLSAVDPRERSTVLSVMPSTTVQHLLQLGYSYYQIEHAVRHVDTISLSSISPSNVIYLIGRDAARHPDHRGRDHDGKDADGWTHHDGSGMLEVHHHSPSGTVNVNMREEDDADDGGNDDGGGGDDMPEPHLVHYAATQPSSSSLSSSLSRQQHRSQHPHAHVHYEQESSHSTVDTMTSEHELEDHSYDPSDHVSAPPQPSSSSSLASSSSSSAEDLGSQSVVVNLPQKSLTIRIRIRVTRRPLTVESLLRRLQKTWCSVSVDARRFFFAHPLTDLTVWLLDDLGWSSELEDEHLRPDHDHDHDHDHGHHGDGRRTWSPFGKLVDGCTISVRTRRDVIKPPQAIASLGISQEKLSALRKSYIGWRSVRGDGNCYYRAVYFGLIEYIIIQEKRHLFLRVQRTLMAVRAAAEKAIGRGESVLDLLAQAAGAISS